MSQQVRYRYPHSRVSGLAAAVSLSLLISSGIPALSAGKPSAKKCATPAKVQQTSSKADTVADKSDVMGLVLQVTGTWESVNGEKKVPIKQGDGVRSGWKLKRVSPDGSITIARTDGENVKCPGCTACDEPLGASLKEAQADNWMAKAISLFVKKPHTWAVAESRGGLLNSKLHLQDAVVKSDGGKVNVRSVFNTAHDGTLYVTLYSISDNRNPKYCMGPEGVVVQGDQPAVLHAPKLAPGLYRINVSPTKEELGEDSWILVSDPKHYDKNFQQFQSALKSSESLKTETAPNTVQQLLRAYLATMGSTSK